MKTTMKLTAQEQAILDGKEGATKAKIMETMVRYGELFGAKRMVEVSGPGHLVTSFGLGLLKPVYRIMDEIIDAGLKTKYPFSMDPRPIDYENVKCSLLNKLIFSKIMYSKQADYEKQLEKVGLMSNDAWSCTSYLKQTGNTPKKGDILSWAESSAVVFANSVLGARCNRNSGMIDIFGAILNKVPEFGLLTDEGRKANWVVELKTTKLPEAQILGSAIGLKVMDGVPFVKGLDRFIGNKLDDETISYLKDFGAATASNGAVGLYHIQNLTPEAKEQGESLINGDALTYVIDDAELERVYKSYPVMWKNANSKPSLCFIGCPHLSLDQLVEWTKNLEAKLKEKNRKKVTVRTIFTTSPEVFKVFEKTEDYKKLLSFGVKVSSICALMYTNNPIAGGKPIITNSNKLRTYSKARYYKNEDILEIITGGRK